MMLWYLARAAGFTALIAATASVALGAMSSSTRARDPQRLDRRILRQLAHRSAAVVTLAMLALHVSLLVLDRYIDLTLSGALLPLTAGYRPIALAFGTLATYGLLLVAATGAARGRLAGSDEAARTWRTVHLSAYVVWALAIGHGILAGTDTGLSWSWALYGGCAATVLVAGTIRLGAVVVHHAAPLPTARRRLNSGGLR